MFVQTEITPNPNSVKFIPGKVVSNGGSFEITKKDNVKNELLRNILSINGVEGIFLNREFISINKYDKTNWDEIKHIIILLPMIIIHLEKYIVDKDINELNENLSEIEKIVQILDQKWTSCCKRWWRYKFKEFRDGIVKFNYKELFWLSSSTMTLKQGVQNLLCHYIPEVKEVAI